MELMIKMSAAEADEAMAKGLIQALVYPFSCREEVRKAAEKPEEVKKEELKEVQAPVEEEPAEKKPVAEEQKAPEAEPAEKKPVAEEKIKLTDIRKRLTKAKQDGQRDLMKVLFKDFGIKNLTDLKEDQYANFYAKAEEVFNA
jgi:D-alanyl-D-alanine carboxypeptidase